ncbi:MAG: mechanosensitive ion channel family protein, partial [Cyanothece sp. SIO2G6]|nr:mechanosensitive ion channel family protein [Cyanothece sp. SIO2G6]
NLDIENVTRGKKVMVMLYLDFSQDLKEEDAALVKQVVTRSTESLFGIDPGSTSISFVTADGTLDKNSQTPFTRARVTFFILGSSEDSIALRKRLLELASEKIAKRLTTYDIAFTMPEPTIYVESPVTI